MVLSSTTAFDAGQFSAVSEYNHQANHPMRKSHPWKKYEKPT
jgi:hypothetical protein